MPGLFARGGVDSKRFLRALATGLLFTAALAAPGRAESPIGDLSLLAGGAWPQGPFTRFANPGPVFSARVTPQLPGVVGLTPWLDLSGIIFSEDQGLTEVETPNFIVLAEESRSEWGLSIHAGLQLGSPTRLGFFRPRIGIGPGFYVLNRSSSVTLPGEVDPFDSDTFTLGRAGFRGAAGADFFFTPNWGIAAEFLYDHIWSIEGRKSGRFQGFRLGVSFAMERIDVAAEPPSVDEGQ